MTKDNDHRERISRRAMLSGTTLAKGQQSCAVCINFQPPNACKFVDGTISPNGWCQLFAAKT